jgi:hypothetical protein
MSTYQLGNQAEALIISALGLVRNERQTYGTGYDAVHPANGKKFEIKFDHAAQKTGNLYLEVRQVYAGQRVARSGVGLLQADYYLYLVGDECLALSKDTAAEFIASPSFREVGTRNNANGNIDGSYTRGKLVPVSVAREKAHRRFKLVNNALEEIT